jgi:hypothetical protein
MGLRPTNVDEDASWRTHFACRVHIRVNARGSLRGVRKSANTARKKCVRHVSVFKGA